MPRQDHAYWQRLRVDKRSAVAASFSAVAAVCTVVNFLMVTIGMASQAESRSDPVYWLVMLRLVWWVVQIGNYEPVVVRWWNVALLIICLMNVVALLVLYHRGDLGIVTICFAAIAITSAVASMIAYRGSLVAREGPSH